MTNQLLLLNPSYDDFRLDERTKEIGRAGIAAARQALAEARLRSPIGEPVRATTTPPARSVSDPLAA